MKVDGDDVGDEVGGGLILEVLELQELFIENALVEEDRKQAIHVGSQTNCTESKHPQRNTRFGWL